MVENVGGIRNLGLTSESYSFHFRTGIDPENILTCVYRMDPKSSGHFRTVTNDAA